MKNTSSTRSRKRAQGMTEYVIIVGLIAILMVGAVTKFKDALKGAFTKSTNQVTNKITNQIK